MSDGSNPADGSDVDAVPEAPTVFVKRAQLVRGLSRI